MKKCNFSQYNYQKVRILERPKVEKSRKNYSSYFTLSSHTSHTPHTPHTPHTLIFSADPN
ncbi:MAG: hypothetical protein F6K40_19790 [Okeania sp. SIO3I5]|nr:hypothetical protein [Okeania sp. SIO3I5]